VRRPTALRECGVTKIIIADDHAVVRKGVRQILAEEADLKVVGEAANFEETLRAVRDLDWDVLILDYSMPGGNGLQVLKKIHKSHPNRPILVLSMHPEEVVAIPALRAGAAGYISKDSASEELPAAIRKAVGGEKYVSASLAQRLALELEEGSHERPHEALSDREYRVMWMLASGESITRIAAELSLSPNTVSTYRTRILRKLKLANNADLVRYAMKYGLLG
jgi:two-component system, NarL family, invasion response regulator UvrY